MNYKKQVFLNTFGNVAYLFAQWLLTVITTRKTGVEDAGVFSLAISVSNIFYSVQIYGMRSYQVSDTTGKISVKQYVNSRYITTFFGGVLCIGFVLFSSYDLRKKCAIIFYMLSWSVMAIMDAYYGEMQKKGRLDISAKSLIARAVLRVAVFIAVINITKSLLLSLMSLIFVELMVSIIYDVPRYHKIIGRFQKKASPRESLVPLQSCFLLMVSSLLPIIITSYPRMVLDKLYGSDMLGYYGNVSTPTALITSIVPSILVPIMTLYGTWVQENKYNKLLRGFLASLAVTVAIGAVCALGVFLLGDFVMALVYTEDILPYVHYLYPLLLSTTIYAATMCGNSLLISLRKNRAVLIFSAASMCCCILMCSPLIEKNGISGVIAATGISYSVQFLGQLIYLAVLMSKYKKKSSVE